MPAASLSSRHARRLALRSQGLLGARPDRDPRAMLRRLRAVQLDTISVLARSHELVAYARLGAIPRTAIEKAYWGGPPYGSFEFWAHAACVIPIEDWPFYEWRRRAIRERGRRWHRLEDADKSLAEVLARLRSDGPLTANQLGGAKKGGVWWDWSETKIAVEWLLDIGEVVCRERRGFQRVYDLAERAVPPGLLSAEYPRDEQLLHLLKGAGRAMGVARVRDLATYCSVRRPDVERLVGDAGLVPVSVEGWREAGWADPVALEAGTARMRSRPLMLSPFDSLIWDRERVEGVFGFRHRLEAYTPASKRVYGYFAMPLLVGDSLVGRIDPKRDGSVLVAKGVHLDSPALPDAIVGAAEALWSAASWVGCSEVRVDVVTPQEVAGALASAVAEVAAAGGRLS